MVAKKLASQLTYVDHPSLSSIRSDHYKLFVNMCHIDCVESNVSTTEETLR